MAFESKLGWNVFLDGPLQNVVFVCWSEFQDGCLHMTIFIT